jgi:peptidoglycan/xylan/chitin deacetylase (PgdA/CDA1 family)
MNDGCPQVRGATITTSWDDGHLLDIRVAELLASYDMVGTFYVPWSCPKLPAVTRAHLHALRQMGMEIGSHTLRHHELTKLDTNETLTELIQSKDYLENVLGEPVTSLCYPKGKFNQQVRALVAEAGYTLGRTTLAFRTDRNFDPLCMPVSLQIFPHTPTVHIKHALKEGNLRGIANWYKLWRMEYDPVRLAELIVDHIQNTNGICHIWGHSWEIEQFGLWSMLEDIVRHMAHREGLLYLTNTQVLSQIGP